MTNVTWYYRNTAGEEIGPIVPAELMAAVKAGLIQPETQVRQRDGAWMAAHRIQALFADQPLSAPLQTAPVAQRAVAVEPVPSHDPVPSHLAASHPAASHPAASHPAASNLEVIDGAETAHFKLEILAYKKLILQNSLAQNSLAQNPLSNAAAIYYANQLGTKLKQIKITLKNGEAITESGALQYLHGNITIENKSGGMAGLGKAVLKSLVTNETIFRPRYSGTGTIYLEPTFGHYLIYPLNGEELIVDKGLYACSEGAITVGVATQKNLSAGMAGGEGWFQTKVSGRGICVFVLPVPMENVRCVELHNETLQVDGSFALMRTGNISFSVEKSTKGILGTVTSGEGLLQTFRGTGKVWLAPTLGHY
jgi:uncharacterized protein (AIM24 family)